MRIPFNFELARKILLFFSIINLAILPLCLMLNLNIFMFYMMAVSFEGFCAFILGIFRVFNSLFSTMEVEDREYIGDGFIKYQLRVIELFGHEVLTGEKLVEPKVENGEVISDIDRDVLKLTSISRYTKKKSISVAFATGSGLKKGAVATSVGHDAHNMCVLGTNDEDMLVAANRVIELGGGLVISNNGKVVAELPLPIAGLMSDLSSEEVAERLGILKKVLKDFGSVLPDLFMTLSFVQLAVIPKLKLTNMGLVDVTKNKFVHLFEGR